MRLVKDMTAAQAGAVERVQKHAAVTAHLELGPIAEHGRKGPADIRGV